MEGEEEEGRREETAVCWPVAPGGPEAEEVGEERREGLVEVLVARTQGKVAGVCCCETGREEQKKE